MEDSHNPELDAPSEALKQEFRTVIEAAVGRRGNGAQAPLEDGRTIEVAITTGEQNEGDNSCSALILEDLEDRDGKPYKHATYCYVFADGHAEKTIEIWPPTDPGTVAELDQIQALRQEMEKEGRSREDINKVLVDKVLERIPRTFEQIPDGVRRLLNDIKTINLEKELGLGITSAELRLFIQEVKAAFPEAQQ